MDENRTNLPTQTAVIERTRNPFARVIVVSAEHITDYKLRITFSDKKVVVIDFYTRFLKLQGYCSKYQHIANFKNFRIAHGNVVWGEYSDVAFPVSALYNGQVI